QPLSRAKTGCRLPNLAGAALGHHRHGTGCVRTAVESPTFFDRSPASDDLYWPETVKEQRELTETHRNFKASDLPPPATISVDPGYRSVQESTTGPLLVSAPPRNVEDFGFRQNTGVTLPNFRQKSKEILKSNGNKKGK
ncbi:hypothetical protein Prudu_008919, partial [Prunus dulcis]